MRDQLYLVLILNIFFLEMFSESQTDPKLAAATVIYKYNITNIGIFINI